MSDPWTRTLSTLRPAAECAGEPGLDHTLHTRMRFYNVSAVSLAWIRDGRLQVEAGFGTLAADDPHPADAQTLFSACSVGKAVTAAAALRLVAAGRATLDGPVNEHMKSWRLRDVQGRPSPASLRQLLTHTAGVNVHGAAGYDPAGPVPTLDQLLEGQPPSLTPPVRVTAEPGAGYRYSSGGYLVVQRLIEDLSGSPFEAALRALVFGPLGMQRSCFRPPDPNHAAAHVSTIRRAAPETHLAWPEQAAAGLWTTAGDLARLTAALQGAATGCGEFLPQDLAQDALRRQTPHRDVGLGLYLLGDGPARRFSHTGAHLGWRAEMLGWLSGGHGLAVMLNNGYTGSELKAEIIDAAVRAHRWPA